MKNERKVNVNRKFAKYGRSQSGPLAQIRRFWPLYVFISVFFILSIMFGIYPMLKSIYCSFFKTNTVLTDPQFVGLKNYKNIFHDPYFWDSLKVTIKFTLISVPLNLVFALLLAQLLDYRGVRKGQLIFKLAIFLPFITPDVVGSVIWKQFFSSNGAMNHLLSLVGMEPVEWLTSPGAALAVLAFVELWKHVGLYTIIFLTNYQLIDRTMYEAASIDGANGWQTYFYITLPALKAAFVLNAVYAFIQFMKTYTTPRIITFGGPNYATNFLSYYAYSKYDRMDLGAATAIATFLFLFIAVLTMIGSKLGEEKK